MKCPECQGNINYTFGLYLKSFFGRFKCPACKAKLALTDIKKELAYFTLAISILVLILCSPDSNLKSYGVLAWFGILFIMLPFEYKHYKSKSPKAIKNVT
jgi:uncharacterized paraquat-inducible protein A